MLISNLAIYDSLQSGIIYLSPNCEIFLCLHHPNFSSQVSVQHMCSDTWDICLGKLADLFKLKFNLVSDVLNLGNGLN